MKAITAYEKYNIITDGNKVMPFSFDSAGPSCLGSYFKEYTVVVKLKSTGSLVSSPSWLTLNSH
jgi:hypothetical protein